MSFMTKDEWDHPLHKATKCIDCGEPIDKDKDLGIVYMVLKSNLDMYFCEECCSRFLASFVQDYHRLLQHPQSDFTGVVKRITDDRHIAAFEGIIKTLKPINQHK